MGTADAGHAGFGALLRRRRVAAGLTQEELAERSALSVRAVRDLERGRTSRPYRGTARRLSTALALDETAAAEFMDAARGARPAAAPPAAVVPQQLPTAIPHFTGRTAELDALSGLLDDGPGDTVVVSVIGGTAGVGKTSLAVHWAHQVADRFPDGQLYVNLRGFGPSGEPVTADDALRGFLDALAVPAGRIPAGAEAKAGLFRSLLAGRRMLILLDNARDTDQVRPLLPGGPGCVVLVTGRSQLTGLAAAVGAHLLRLDVLTETEAHELLARRLGTARVTGEPEAVAELAGRCARLPLALAIAAARTAARPAFPLADLAAELRDTGRRLEALDTGDAAASVEAVFSWSYRALDEPAAAMFRLLGLHPGPDISVPAAASLAGVGRRQARTLLRELTAKNLLTEHTPGRFAFHDLLRAYATELAESTDGDGERQAATGRMLDHYLHTAHAANQMLNRINPPLDLAPPRPGTQPETIGGDGPALAWFETEYPVLLAVTDLAAAPPHGRAGTTASDRAASAPPDRAAWQIPWALASFLNRRGRWRDMITTQTIALSAAERRAEPAGLAHAHHYLGRACVLLGRYDAAATHLTTALTTYETLGDAANQARVHGELGRSFELQGQYRSALEHAQRGLSLFRAAGHRAGQANALNAVGWYESLLGDYRQAKIHCEQALELLRALGDRHSEAATWDSLGYAHHNLGQYAEAITCYGNALDIRRESIDRYDESRILTHLGDAHAAAGDDRAARDAWQRALAILTDLHHPDADEMRARLSGREDRGAGPS